MAQAPAGRSLNEESIDLVRLARLFSSTIIQGLLLPPHPFRRVCSHPLPQVKTQSKNPIYKKSKKQLLCRLLCMHPSQFFVLNLPSNPLVLCQSQKSLQSSNDPIYSQNPQCPLPLPSLLPRMLSPSTSRPCLLPPPHPGCVQPSSPAPDDALGLSLCW